MTAVTPLPGVLPVPAPSTGAVALNELGFSVDGVVNAALDLLAGADDR